MTLSMSKGYSVVATPVFKLTLRKLCSFIKRKHTPELANKTRVLIKQRVRQLSVNPLLAPVSERLTRLGFTGYHQLQIDSHNLVFYRIDEEGKKVVLLLVMDNRQSIEQLLYETTIQLDI